MKSLILLTVLSLAFTVEARTAQQDSAQAISLMRKKDSKQNNPYTFADDSVKTKKTASKPKKKTR